jgi:hypothetical protein
MQASFVQRLGVRFVAALVRFPLAIAGIIVCIVLLILEELQPSFDLSTRWWVFYSLAAVVSLAVVMAVEGRMSRWLSLVIQLVLAATVFWYSTSVPDHPVTSQVVQLVVLYGVSILLAYVLAYLKPQSDGAFRRFAVEVTLQGVIAYVFAGVLMGGLSLALFSVESLFGLKVAGNVYDVLAILCMVGFGPLYLLSNIPVPNELDDEEPTLPKVMKVLGMYILLPILSLYLVILYVYLITIVVQWQLPDGWVSTLISVLALGGFVTMAIVYPLVKQNDKLVNWLFRFFPLLLLPLLVLMSVGIARRLGDYGLTINRGFVLILNGWLYAISIYLFLTRSRHLKWIVVSFAVVAFLSVTGPWSVASITEKRLVNELRNELQLAGYLQEKQQELNLTEERRERISELSEYLSGTFGKEVLKSIESDPHYTIEVETLLANRYTSKDERRLMDVWLISKNEQLQLTGVDLVYYFDYPLSKASENSKIETGADPRYNDGVLLFRNQSSKELVEVPIEKELSKIAKHHKKGEYTLKQALVEGKGYKLVVSRVHGWYDETNDDFEIKEAKVSVYVDYQ